MRIAHLVDRPGDVGGVRTYLGHLLPALAARGVENVVFTGVAADPLAGASTVHAPTVASDAARLDAGAREQLTAQLRAASADVVYAHLARNPAVVVTASSCAPVVLYAHDYYAVCPGSMRYLERSATLCTEGPGMRCFVRAYTERTTSRRPDRLVRAYGRVRAWRTAWPHLSRVFVASPFVAELLAGDGVPRELLRVVPYFTRPAPTEPAAPEQDVLFLNRLVSAKGADVLLRALAATEGITAAIAGDGPDRQSLERLALELGLGERVRFLGWVSPEQRTRLLASSRVLVVPSLWDEPFGIVGIEAFAAGLPVIGAAVGGIPSWLSANEGGLLFPRGDAAALAGALRRLLGDEELRRAQAARAHEAATRFTLDRHLELLLPELRAAAGAA
jgi:glycosyltransferase involved in cell wall biosynthesis